MIATTAVRAVTTATTMFHLVGRRDVAAELAVAALDEARGIHALEGAEVIGLDKAHVGALCGCVGRPGP